MASFSCSLQGSPFRIRAWVSIDIGRFLDQSFDNGQMTTISCSLQGSPSTFMAWVSIDIGLFPYQSFDNG
jgi:hypothetical protein